MPLLSRGAALVALDGTLLAADAGFRSALGLPAPGAAEALRALAAAEPGLAALLSGRGPDELALGGPGGLPLRLERHGAEGGALVVLRAEGDDERLEHAARSRGLGQLAMGLSHDVNGPLNTMTLQLALLGEKLGDVAAGRLAGHLGALRDQVARVARMVRRFREVVDPPAPLGGLDLGIQAAEALALLGHDLHRRSIQLTLEAAPGLARTSAAPERAARLVLGLLQRCAAATPDGGTLTVAVEARGDRSALTVTHPPGAGRPDLGYDFEVAAAAARALGGLLAWTSEEGRAQVTLQLPRGHGA